MQRVHQHTDITHYHIYINRGAMTLTVITPEAKRMTLRLDRKQLDEVQDILAKAGHSREDGGYANARALNLITAYVDRCGGWTLVEDMME